MVNLPIYTTNIFTDDIYNPSTYNLINKYRDIAMQKKMLITFANYDKYITVGIASHFEYPEEANKFALENNQDFILAIIPPKSRTSKEEFNAHNS